MVVTFTESFLKKLVRATSKKEAKTILEDLDKTKVTDGKFITLIKNVMIRERKLKSFRFYFVHQYDTFEIMTEEEIKDRILKFVALSKKNNQDDVIQKLKKDLLENGFEF